MTITPDGDTLQHEVINSRAIQITSSELITPLIDGQGEIIAIECGDYFIQIDDEFDTRGRYLKNKYKIKYIEQLTKNKYLLLTHQRNRTTSYILPCLEGDKNLFYVDHYLINPYLSENLTYLYLLYRFNTHESYKKMESSLTKHKQFVSFSDEISSYVVFKFKIPEEYHKDCELFMQGKYSKFSAKLKKRIQQFNKFDRKQSIIQTIFKDQERKIMLEKALSVSIPETIDLDSRPSSSLEIWNNSLMK